MVKSCEEKRNGEKGVPIRTEVGLELKRGREPGREGKLEGASPSELFSSVLHHLHTGMLPVSTATSKEMTFLPGCSDSPLWRGAL